MADALTLRVRMSDALTLRVRMADGVACVVRSDLCADTRRPGAEYLASLRPEHPERLLRPDAAPTSGLRIFFLMIMKREKFDLLYSSNHLRIGACDGIPVQITVHAGHRFTRIPVRFAAAVIIPSGTSTIVGV